MRLQDAAPLPRNIFHPAQIGCELPCSQYLLLTGTSRESPSACVQIESVIIQWPMKSRVLVLTLALSVCVGWAVPELQGQPQPTTSILVKAGKLLDVRNGSYI